MSTDTAPDRRRFIAGGLAAGAATGLAACSGRDDGALPAAGVAIGSVEEVRGLIAAGGGAHHVPEAKAFLVEIDLDHRVELAAQWGGGVGAGIEAGFIALGQKCPHQGCRVTLCDRSGWFECPCHGSRFSPAGELRRGPAPRGLSAHAVEVSGGQVRIVGDAVDGLAEDVDVTAAPDPGEHCF